MEVVNRSELNKDAVLKRHILSVMFIALLIGRFRGRVVSKKDLETGPAESRGNE